MKSSIAGGLSVHIRTAEYHLGIHKVSDCVSSTCFSTLPQRLRLQIQRTAHKLGKVTLLDERRVVVEGIGPRGV